MCPSINFLPMFRASYIRQKDPNVLLQTALTWHLCAPLVLSSKSKKNKTSSEFTLEI